MRYDKMYKAYMSQEWKNSFRVLRDWKEGKTFEFEDYDELNTVKKY
jgi:hypothetical protein